MGLVKEKRVDLHAKVRNASRVPLNQHTMHNGAGSRTRDKERRDPRVISMKMMVMIMSVVMTVRMLVTRVAMIVRM